MRQIKFRAFDLESQSMKEVEMIVTYLKKDDNWMLWEVFYEWEKHSHYYWDWEIIECKLMQFTWLLDKNWKEVYEWDLLKTEINSRIWIYEIIFSSWCFRKALRYRSFEYEEDSDSNIYWDFYFNWTEWWADIFTHTNFTEIIWNIYENKELL